MAATWLVSELSQGPEVAYALHSSGAGVRSPGPRKVGWRSFPSGSGASLLHVAALSEGPAASHVLRFRGSVTYTPRAVLCWSWADLASPFRGFLIAVVLVLCRTRAVAWALSRSGLSGAESGTWLAL